jgi:hypothetical protein
MQIKLQLQARLVAEVIVLFLVFDRGGIANAASGTLPPATQTYYQFTTIDIPAIPGSPEVDAFGINDRGLVSGGVYDPAWNAHGFLWETGRVTIIDAPGWVNTFLGQNNNEGVIVGDYDDSIVSHACLYSVPTRTWAALPDVAGKPVNWGNWINNHGVAVGTAFEGTASGSIYNGVAWSWNGSAYSFFTVPGASGSLGTYASGINDHGQICGYYKDSQGVYHGFVKDGETITSIDVPGARGGPNSGTGPGNINNEGEVAGPYIAGGLFHGFVLRGGVYVTVDVPGATQTYIHGNNNRGDLVGMYWDSSGRAHGFVATPERLSIVNTGTNVLISWPVAAVTFQLQSTPSLSGNISWSPVPQAAATNGNMVSVVVAASPGPAYFRLRRVP